MGDETMAAAETTTLVNAGASVGAIALYAASLGATVHVAEADPDSFGKFVVGEGRSVVFGHVPQPSVVYAWVVELVQSVDSHAVAGRGILFPQAFAKTLVRVGGDAVLNAQPLACVGALGVFAVSLAVSWSDRGPWSDACARGAATQVGGLLR